jgi:hypothetical protein
MSKLIIFLIFSILLLSLTRRVPNFTLEEKKCDSKVSYVFQGEKKIDLKDSSLQNGFEVIGSTFGLIKRKRIPIGDIFSSPRTNLLITIQNAGEEGNLKCEASSYISTLTTLLTGREEKEHLIYGNKWPIDNGKFKTLKNSKNSNSL